MLLRAFDAFALPLFGDVPASADQGGNGAARVADGFPNRIELPNRTVWTKDSLGVGEATPMRQCCGHGAFDPLAIVRVQAREKPFERDRAGLRFEPIDSIEL